MNRAQALLYLKPRFDSLMLNVGRGCADDGEGYSPSLDAAFIQYIQFNALTGNVMNTVVESDDEAGFTALLQAVEYDLLLPFYALQTDISVDAPLTNVKFSQSYRALKELRDAAWAQATEYGYVGGEPVNAGGFVLDLAHSSTMDVRDYREFG